jgi:high frequency lysogenization protein
MNRELHDRTLALAAVYQAASVTQNLARRGECDNDELNAVVRSVLITDAIDTASVYGGLQGVAAGLRILAGRQGLGAGQASVSDFEIARYVLGLTQLAGRLIDDKQMVATLGQRLQNLPMPVSHSGEDGESSVHDWVGARGEMHITDESSVDAVHDAAFSNGNATAVSASTFARLADIYADTISKLAPQIVVHGERGYLGEQEVVDKVRSALLGGVRGAWLWLQLGGRKWHLVFLKKTYARAANELLRNL